MNYQTLNVPENYIGLILGKKGKTIKKIESKFNVKIFLEKKIFHIYSFQENKNVLKAKNYMFRIYEKKIQEEETCPICMDSMDFTQNFVKTPCGHSFHFSCLQESLKRNSSCPLCRKDLQEGKDKDIESIINKTIRAMRRTNYTFYLYYYLNDIYSYQLIVEEFFKEPLRHALRLAT